MLNWAARYYPILRVLRQNGLLKSGSLLEIGCGPRGIGTFRKVPFTGCDINFPDAPIWPMTPVIASAAELPFEDRSFDAIVASDVLEHIPSELRKMVIAEALRVGRRLVIFGFPSGTEAHKADEELRELYISRHVEVPGWLEEHMLASFPEGVDFQGLPGWRVAQFGNENIRFHSWMMRREFSSMFVRMSGVARRAAPWLLEPLLRQADRPPYYRQIFVLTRLDQIKGY